MRRDDRKQTSQQNDPKNSHSATRPPRPITLTIPNLLTVRQEPDPKGKERYAEEKADREAILATARRLNWITAAAALISLVGLGVVGLSIYESSKAFQTDERAWLTIAPNLSFVNAGSPVNEDIQLKNIGKTLATNIALYTFVEFVENGKEPDLNFSSPSLTDTTRRALLAPTEIDTINVARLAGLPGASTPARATQAEADDYGAGKTWLAVHGVLMYDDIFGRHHWVRFCFPSANTSGTFSIGRCTADNRVGDGKP
jgi:hypothetical protein